MGLYNRVDVLETKIVYVTKYLYGNYRAVRQFLTWTLFW